MHEPVAFTLPEPPSANRWWRKWRGRMVIAPAAQAYKDAVAAMLRVQPLQGDIGVQVVWYRARKSGDLDKRFGILLDALQGVAYKNDAQIAELHAQRRDDDRNNPRVEVLLWEIQ